MSTQESNRKKPISQKALAEYLKLSPSTVSLVMNDAPRAKLIPDGTRQRVLDAAAEFDYRPDFYAKYLYSKRSFTVAVMLREIREPYASAILAGIDRKLTQEKYLYFTANHYAQESLIRDYPRRLLERAVEGFLLINTTPETAPERPTVMIGGAPRFQNIPRVTLNNHRGGELALEYLARLGHREIAVIKGHPWRAASEPRFQGVVDAAHAYGFSIDQRLVRELRSGNSPLEVSMPEEGYTCTLGLLAAKVPFTALIAWNDVTAIGAIRACNSAGLRVPEDISVIGFDDIESAAYLTPSLTTLRQPLEQMGELAAEHLLGMIAGGQPPVCEVLMDPTLIERESAAPRMRT